MEAKTELQKNAIAEVRRKELESYQRALDIQWLNSRMEDGRMGRCLALIQKEAEMEKDYQERTDHAAIVNARAEKETKLGIEVAKVARENACELLRRHYLRERDPGLRELMKKLQAGYVRRDLQQQILHNEYKRLQEKSEEDKANRILRNALYNDKEEKEKEEKIKLEKEAKYRMEIQQQLVSRQRVKQCEYEDRLIEKKMLDDIMRTIADEDQRELQQKRDQTDKMRQEMMTFKQARDAWKEKQKKMVVKEEQEIERQARAAADRSSAAREERARKLREREEINQKIATKILADEAEIQERTNLIKLLQEQEYLEKNFQDDIAEQQKVERTRSDTKSALTAQMEQRRLMQKEQKEKEANFRKTVEAKIAEDDRKEQEKQRIKKENAKKCSQELLKQIQDNQKRREKEKIMEANRAQLVWDGYKKWDEEVKNERSKIVSEHVPQVLGFLQAGVVQQEDLSALSAGGHQLLDVQALAQPTRPKRYSKCNAQCRLLRQF